MMNFNLKEMNLVKVLITVISFTVLLTLTSCDSSSPLIEHFKPSGSYTLSYEKLPEIDQDKNFRLGGFSGLHYKGGRTFFTITNRGPVLKKDNQVSLMLEDFCPEIVELELLDDNTIKIANRIKLVAPDANFTSGKLPDNRIGMGEDLIGSGNDNWGINPAGIYFDKTNNFFWFSDLYNPGLFQTTEIGYIVKRLRPDEGIRRAYKNSTTSGGFSGVDMDEQNRLVSILNGGLNNRAFGDDSSIVDKSIRRISRVDYTKNRALFPQTEISMFYKVESESLDGIPEDKISLGDIAVVNDSLYLITEYANVDSKIRSLLYLVKNINATKIVESQEGLIGKTYETLLPEEIEKYEIEFNFVKKELIADLSSLGINNPTGISLVGKNNLAIIQNNMFGIKNADPVAKSYDISETDMKIQIIDISEIYNTEE